MTIPLSRDLVKPRPLFSQSSLFGMLLLGLLATMLCGCPGPVETIVFSPPPGSYDEAQEVYITLQNVAEGAIILFTADGSDPNPEECTIPYTGWPIPVNQSTQLKAIFVRPDGSVSSVATAQYTISGSGGEELTNKAALFQWMEYEETVADWFFCEFNNCAQPGMANFCTGQRHCLPYQINQYDDTGAVIGSVTMEVAVVDLKGQTTITYENFQMSPDLATLVDANDPVGDNIVNPDQIPTVTYDLTASGVLVGLFGLDGSGSQSTSVPIVTSGDYSAVIEDQTVMVAYVRVNGFFTVSCTDPGCGVGPKTYLAPDWDLLAPSNIEDSCLPPFYMIVNKLHGNKCLTRTDGFPIVSNCDPENPYQQWALEPDRTATFLDNDDTPHEQTAYILKARNGSYCFENDSPDTWGDRGYTTGECGINDDRQRWLFWKNEGDNYFRMRDVAEQPCAHVGWWQDVKLFQPVGSGCPGWFDEIYWGLLYEGSLPLVDPTTLPQAE